MRREERWDFEFPKRNGKKTERSMISVFRFRKWKRKSKEEKEREREKKNENTYQIHGFFFFYLFLFLFQQMAFDSAFESRESKRAVFIGGGRRRR